jgi:predicted RNase H-like HicB family nuclease
MARKFNITYVEADGQWMASIYTVPGCHAEGTTKDEARASIKRSLLYFFDDVDVEFTEESLRG